MRNLITRIETRLNESQDYDNNGNAIDPSFGAIITGCLEDLEAIEVSPKTGEPTTAIEYTTSYNRGFYVTTDLELTGRGIRQSGDGSDHKRGKKTYHVTEAAFAKLELNYECTYYNN